MWWTSGVRATHSAIHPPPPDRRPKKTDLPTPESKVAQRVVSELSHYSVWFPNIKFCFISVVFRAISRTVIMTQRSELLLFLQVLSVSALYFIRRQSADLDDSESQFLISSSDFAGPKTFGNGVLSDIWGGGAFALGARYGHF